MNKLKAIKTQDNLILLATFLDGTIKEYDIKPLFKIYPQLKELENRTLFDNVKIDTGGYGVSWNDELDLDAETIWECGTRIGQIPSDLIMEVAIALSKARIQSGLTQKQLAEKTGIYQADISKIERGIGNPSINWLQKLADGMGMDLKITFIPK